MDLVKEFSDYLKAVNLVVVKYSPEKERGLYLKNSIKGIGRDKFLKELFLKLKTTPPDNLELLKIIFREETAIELLNEYLLEVDRALIENKGSNDNLPQALQGLTLNIDITDCTKLFMTDSKNRISYVDAKLYCSLSGIRENEVTKYGRIVYPMYNPRISKNFYEGQIPGYSTTENILNTYIPPVWVEMKPSAKKCPRLFMKLINHLTPNDTDRNYLLYWIRKSLVDRAMVYLVLCGAPGIGKNTLKRVLRALHGDLNLVDGKKSTITTQFNAQLSQGTLIWFDELRYTETEENFMKEIPNDTISIEAKGVDATRSTQLFGSYVISNNKPRDNYLSMDARKFAPVTLTTQRLEKSMTTEEINDLLNKVDSSKPEYDPQFIADIAHYIIENCDSDKWPNDEYRSEMFHILTHTSMTRWQKRAIDILVNLKEGSKKVYGIEKADRGEVNRFKTGEFGSIKCSNLEILFESYNKVQKNNVIFPEYSSVEAFLSYYRDLSGNKIFKVSKIPKNIYNDFCIEKLRDDISIDISEEIDNMGLIDFDEALNYL
jgi:hypothetical protein